MTQDTNEATRVMGAAGSPPDDRTMVAGSAPFTPPNQGGAGATQMGATVTCPVCRTNNSSLETYCGECGFLLSSAPGQEAEAAAPVDAPTYELVENTSGRRFRMKEGVNTVGREHCDILLLEGTVSRRHAQITIENGLVILMDLGSSNGTQIDGSRIGPNQPMPLANNAAVRFGNAVLTVVAPTGAAEAPIMAGAPAILVASAVQVSAPPDAVSEQTLMAPAAGNADQGSAPPEIVTSLPSEAAVSSGAISTPPSSAGERLAVAQLRPVAEGGDSIYIGDGTIGIGRRTGNDIIIDGDPYISGRHCDITCDVSGCYLIDLGSTNGTVVNGTRLEPNQKQLLLDGDAVTIGQTEYTFETLEAPDEEEPDVPAPASDHPTSGPHTQAQPESGGAAE